MRERFHRLLRRLRQPTLRQFAQVGASRDARQPGSGRQLLLCLEQQWKIEEQLLLPALAAEQGRAAELAAQEIEVLRDLSRLAEDGDSAGAKPVWAVLQRLAHLHFCHIDDLFAQDDTGAIDRTLLLSEAQSWLDQWADEIRATGTIDDEDSDPVGQPPR